MELVKISAHLQQPDAFPAVLATFVQVEGSSYRRPGARLIISSHGRRTGSISGGCLETDLVARAQALIKSPHVHEVVTYDTTGENDLLWGVGTGCHGVVKILLEELTVPPDWLPAVDTLVTQRRPFTLATTWRGADDALGTRLAAEHATQSADVANTWIQTVLPPWHLVALGAGDDAQPLIRLAATLGWDTTVVDPRPDMATRERFPEATHVRTLAAETTAAEIRWDDRTVAVIMTHHYRYDLPLLQTLGPLRLPFLGLLGPRDRGKRLRADAGLADDIDLHNPVGLDLGGDGPEAVALSIVAAVQARVQGRNAQPLRDRQRPIHSP